MIDSVPLIQNANDAQQINASIIAMKKASRELDEKIGKLNSLNSELDKKIALLDSGLNKEIEDRKEAINSLDVASVGGSGKYISAISETDGKISATASDITTSVQSGNSQPVTSGGAYDILKNQKTYEFFTPDYTRYVLMQDISTWYNSTSSSVVQMWSMNGMLITQRKNGNDRSEVVNLTLSVGYFRNNQSLPNSLLMHVDSFCLNNLIQACIVRYNSKEYLALKILENQSRDCYFIGYCTSAPSFTSLNQNLTVTELFNGGRTITNEVVQNSPDLITSGAVKTVLDNAEFLSGGLKQRYYFSKSITDANIWTDIVTHSDITSGLYIFYFVVNDSSVFYAETISFILYYYGTETNSSVASPIYFNQAGHSPNAGVIQLRAQRGWRNSSYPYLSIQMSVSAKSSVNPVTVAVRAYRVA